MFDYLREGLKKAAKHSARVLLRETMKVKWQLYSKSEIRTITKAYNKRNDSLQRGKKQVQEGVQGESGKALQNNAQSVLGRSYHPQAVKAIK